MRKIILLFIVSILFFACNNAEKLMLQGNYDASIRKAVKKLRKKPANQKFLGILEEAYNKADARDHQRINFLQKEGNPENWEEIFSIYSRLKQRQDLVKTLSIYPTNIVFKNYDDELINSKKKAAEFLYADALRLLERNDRYAAREAYAKFRKVKSFYSNYKDVDNKIIEAKQLGTNNVIFRVQNHTNTVMPAAFEQELLKLPVSDLNSEWVNFYKNEKEGLFFDYVVLLNIKNIAISPEKVLEKQYYEEKEIVDGWQYVLDENGNVKKDTLGNDIKVDKIVKIRADIWETFQNKTARVSGSLDFLNNRTQELIKSDPVTSDVNFDYSTLRFAGDKRALSPATLKKLGNKPMPFPTNEQMLLDASAKLKNMTKSIVSRNRNLLD